MNITVQGIQLEVTEAIRAYAEKKFGLLTSHLKRFETSASPLALFIELVRTTRHHKRGDVYAVNATVRVPGKTLRTEAHDADLHAAIDRAKDALKFDIGKLKERRVAATRRGVSANRFV